MAAMTNYHLVQLHARPASSTLRTSARGGREGDMAWCGQKRTRGREGRFLPYFCGRPLWVTPLLIEIICCMCMIVCRVWRQECITSELVQLPMPFSLPLTSLVFWLRIRQLRRHVETFSLLQASLLQTMRPHFCVHWKTKRIVLCAAVNYHSACSSLYLRNCWITYAKQLLLLVYIMR